MRRARDAVAVSLLCIDCVHLYPISSTQYQSVIGAQLCYDTRPNRKDSTAPQCCGNRPVVPLSDELKTVPILFISSLSLWCFFYSTLVFGQVYF